MMSTTLVPETPLQPSRFTSETAIVVYLSLIQVVVHFFIHSEFEFHRDEFLYIDLGKNLHWGYLEVPPGIAMVAAVSRMLFGESYIGYHVLPALAGAGIVFLTGTTAKELGGNRFSQVLAALSVLTSPAYIRSAILFQPVVFEQFYWTLTAYLIVRLLRRQDRKLWILIGLTIGVGLMNKYSMALFAISFAIGFLITSDRVMLKTQWPWIGVLIALTLLVPNLIWQASEQWPFFDHLQKLKETQLAHVSVAGFLIAQLLMSPNSFLVWLLGIYYYLADGEGKRFRALGVTYASALLILLAMHGKDYYLLPMYPMLLAGGACFIGGLNFVGFRAVRTSLIAAMILFSLPTLPYAIPILPVEKAQDYFAWMAEHAGMSGPLYWETGDRHKLPQDYADMMGWEEIAKAVSEVYRNLPPEQRSACAVFGDSYVFAGVINYYGPSLGLPKAISLNGSYYLWGPRGYSGDPMITINVRPESLKEYYEDVVVAAWHTHPYAREDRIPICVCRKPRVNLEKAWPSLSRFRY